MKRFISLLFALVFAVSVAAAEIDLSGMKYNELIALQHQLVAEIMSRPEWKKVTVPAGEWLIGEDIPSGSYSITALNDICTVYVDSIEGDPLYSNCLSNAGDKIGKLTLKTGTVLILEDSVILAPVALIDF